MQKVINRQDNKTVSLNAEEVIRDIEQGLAQYAVIQGEDVSPRLLVYDRIKNKILMLETNNLCMSLHHPRNNDIKSYINNGILYKIDLKLK